MRRLAARLVLAAAGCVGLVVVGAEVRGDWRLDEPARDVAAGLLVVAAAAAVRWAAAELGEVRSVGG